MNHLRQMGIVVVGLTLALASGAQDAPPPDAGAADSASPMMGVSRLLKSWATPPAIRPDFPAWAIGGAPNVDVAAPTWLQGGVSVFGVGIRKQHDGRLLDSVEQQLGSKTSLGLDCSGLVLAAYLTYELGTTYHVAPWWAAMIASSSRAACCS